ncbi:MAG: B12-binding domain-containing radical SAM protein [Desulfobaccales bacterium]
MAETCKLDSRKTLLPPLGLMTVAALLPATWEFRLVDLNVRALTADDWQWADLVMVSGMIIQREGVLSLIREAKDRGKTVVVGGPYATSLSQEVLDAGADFLVRGEAENLILSLLAALERGTPGVVIEAAQRPELTGSPIPRFDLIRFDDYATLGVQTCRGCPFDCEFCDIVSLYGRTPRYKDPEQIIAELETLYRLGWRRQIFFSDDNFIGNKKHARAILNRLIPWMKSHGEPFAFWTQTSVNLGEDLEIIDLLTAANFAYVFLGVETPEPGILRAAGKYQNLRSPLENSLATINANGLNIVASFIIGFDGEQSGAVDRIGDFAEELAIPVLLINILQPLPNTRLWKRLKDEGRLLHNKPSGDFYGMEFNYLPNRPQEEILAEFVRGIDRLYGPTAYLARTYRYFLTMRPTRRVLSQGQLKTTFKAQSSQSPPVPLRVAITKLFTLIKLIWRQGIWPAYRWQFWRQLWGIYRQNPSRMLSYIMVCALGENLFDLRKKILFKWSRRT